MGQDNGTERLALLRFCKDCDVDETEAYPFLWPKLAEQRSRWHSELYVHEI